MIRLYRINSSFYQDFEGFLFETDRVSRDTDGHIIIDGDVSALYDERRILDTNKAGKVGFAFDENGIPVTIDENSVVSEIGGNSTLQTHTLAEVLALTDVAEGTQYIVSDYPVASRSIFVFTNKAWRYANLSLYEIPLYLNSVIPNVVTRDIVDISLIGTSFPTGAVELRAVHQTVPELHVIPLTLTTDSSTQKDAEIDFSGFSTGTYRVLLEFAIGVMTNDIYMTVI